MGNFTIKDIALEAGVSKTTVSRVLNGAASVLPETRERILDIISRNNYTPSATARNLSKSTSDAIGFIVPEIDNQFFGAILRTVIKKADQKKLTLICCNTDDDMHRDMRALDVMKEQRVRGLIYTPAVEYEAKKERAEVLAKLRALEVPVVFLDRKINTTEFDSVCFDDLTGMYNATKALLDKGHRKIAIINATLERPLAAARYRGYEKALLEAGIQPLPEYNFNANYNQKRAYEMSLKMLSLSNRPTAVVTCNNSTTLGFYKAAREMKVEVNKDIACIALDRIDEFEVLGMPMNCIERDVGEMGRQSINLLLNRMTCPDRDPVDIVLKTKLSTSAL